MKNKSEMNNHAQDVDQVFLTPDAFPSFSQMQYMYASPTQNTPWTVLTYCSPLGMHTGSSSNLSNTDNGSSHGVGSSTPPKQGSISDQSIILTSSVGTSTSRRHQSKSSLIIPSTIIEQVSRRSFGNDSEDMEQGSISNPSNSDNGSSLGVGSSTQPQQSSISDQSTILTPSVASSTSRRRQRKSTLRIPSTIIEQVSRRSFSFNSEDMEHGETSTLPDNQTTERHSQLYAKAETTEVFYLGDASYVCSNCQSIMWYEERVVKSDHSKIPKFNICCMKGKITLPFLRKPPQLLYNLMNEIDDRYKNFKENIRAYNSLFSFTSLGGKVESGINDGNGPPQFILSGQNYHRIGSLIPPEGAPPKFAQLYIYDTQNESSNRMKYFWYFVNYLQIFKQKLYLEVMVADAKFLLSFFTSVQVQGKVHLILP
ncbi:uncharacterized protein LOC130712665 [Lotus japonicus]|uniref:uncharacterized protein LOC130712665 n=1 Tax=Lotus japonicus TaxID=34305 RepID=UPI00258FE417|nr:uncharacterized protein LOC130712665 [Lotus japonicus]